MLCSLVKYETGLSPSTTRSLYRSCGLSRSDCRAEIWWKGQKTFMQRLQTQQNTALRRILNAFRSTPTMALHNEAALPPVSVCLQSKQRKNALHILSLPPSHPIVKRCPSSFPITNYLSTTLHDPNEYDFAWSRPYRPPSRLVRALHTLSPWVLPDTDIEDTAQPMAAPWTTPTVRIDIPELPKDEAAIEYLSLLHRLCHNPCNVIAYTDGSQLTGHTGAGYYIPHTLPHPVWAIIPIGTTSKVFDAELKAISECLTSCHKYILQHCLRCRSICLFTDNQSAILHDSKSDRGPTQETALDILHTIGDLLDRAIPVTLPWVPGHTNIAGNEEADRLAKMATSQSPFANIPISLSWLRRQVNEQHTADWIESYYAAPKPKTYDAPHRRRLDSAYTSLPRKQSAAILGLRTSHGYFLDSLAHPPSDNYPSRSCPCPMHPPQTPKHLVLSCPTYNVAWTKLRSTLKIYRNQCLTLNNILHTANAVKALAAMISATKIVTPELARTTLSRYPAEGDTPSSLTTGWGMRLDQTEEHDALPAGQQ
jgi:ribonuclease HI